MSMPDRLHAVAVAVANADGLIGTGFGGFCRHLRRYSHFVVKALISHPHGSGRRKTGTDIKRLTHVYKYLDNASANSMLAMKFSSIVMIFGSMKSTPETVRGQTQCVRLVRSPSPPAFTTRNYRHHWPAGLTNASISNRIQHRLEVGDICDDRIASKTQPVDRTLRCLRIAMAAGILNHYWNDAEVGGMAAGRLDTNLHRDTTDC